MLRAALAAALASSALAGGTVNLTWKDCGSKHGHVDSIAPSSFALGTTTDIVGKGSLDEAVPGGSYAVTAKAGPITVLTHSGDICKPDTINLPLGLGSIQWKGIACPHAVGATEIDMDVQLSGSIPASLASVTVHLTATHSNGDNLLCIDLDITPSEESKEVEVVPEGGVVDLSWKDCGSKHGHVDSIAPSSFALGSTTGIVGKGSLDEAVPAGSYAVTAKAGPITVLTHSGDICKPDTINLPLGLGSIQWKGIACPHAVGATEIDMDVQLSGSIPASLASVSIHLTATHSNGDNLLCVDLETKPAASGKELVV